MRIFIVIFLSVVFSQGSTAVAFAENEFPPLCACTDPVLQEGLESSVGHLGLDEAVQQKCLCIALVDLTDLQAPRMAAVNENEMMYAASLPKIAILLAAFEKEAAGELTLNTADRETLTCMIRNSSNRAATEMMNRIGKEYLAELLQSVRYRLYDVDLNGGLWVGKEYGKRPAWKRDPLHNLSHGATALQVARFYYLLETGRLVSPEVSREMKRMMAEPAIHHKFVKGLDAARPGSTIYRKSGTWREYHADSAIVERNGRRYVAVALAKDDNGGEWLRRLIVAMDDLIFQPEQSGTPTVRISFADDKPR